MNIHPRIFIVNLLLRASLLFTSIFSFSILTYADNPRLKNKEATNQKNVAVDGSSGSAQDDRALKAKDLSDEITIGREMASKLYGTYGQYDSDANKVKYLNLVNQSISREIGRAEITFRVGILDTDELNAFATPGGYILVTKGLLKLIQNEEELAGVLAHEIGHINYKHLYKSVAPKREVSVGETLTRIISLGKADMGASLIKSVQEGMKTLLDQGLKPDLEYEADQSAVSYTWATGYSHKAYLNLLERLSKSTDTKAHVLKTHPTFADRLNALNQFIKENNIEDSGKTLSAKRTNRFKRSMASL
jgi:predicted Zn-dependent protease